MKYCKLSDYEYINHRAACSRSYPTNLPYHCNCSYFWQCAIKQICHVTPRYNITILMKSTAKQQIHLSRAKDLYNKSTYTAVPICLPLMGVAHLNGHSRSHRISPSASAAASTFASASIVASQSAPKQQTMVSFKDQRGMKRSHVWSMRWSGVK